jgi:gamma-glutamylcyclotransferase
VTLLFAYGSNMAGSEMEAASPGARFLGPARLDGHRLELRRRSIRWRGGAADIVPAEGECVWGALYEVDDLDALDAKEGTSLAAYRRRAVSVELRGERLTAEAYEVIEKEREEVPPTREYAELLLASAEERGLPAAYLQELERRLAKE